MNHHIRKYVIAILTVIHFIGLAILPAKASSAQAQPMSGTTKIADRNWDAIVAAAKKEGSVTLYALWIPKIRIGLSQAFKAKYGIDLIFTPFSRGAEILAKVQTEQSAGLYLADVFGAGPGTLVLILKPAGALGSMDHLLVLPETTEGKYWRGGKFPFVDNEKTSVGMIASVQRNIFYNTQLIKKGEITTYKDLLKPQYKGKITINDPSFTGAGKDFFAHLALNVWNLEEAKAYLIQLLKQQEAVVERDNRQHVESVARGKYAIGLGPETAILAEFIKLSAPIDVVILKEGIYIAWSSGAIGVPTKLAHPNATKLFINWLLGKEGQAVFADNFGSPSLRNDVSTAQFNPIFIPQSEEKVFMATEKSLLATEEIIKVAKQIMDETYK